VAFECSSLNSGHLRFHSGVCCSGRTHLACSPLGCSQSPIGRCWRVGDEHADDVPVLPLALMLGARGSGNCIASLSVEWERVDLLVCITVCGLHPRNQASEYSPCLLINCLPGVRVIYSIFLSE
jgi:hypothetical protein